MEQLNRKRGSAQRRVTQFRTYLSTFQQNVDNNVEITEQQIIELEQRFDKIGIARNEFEICQDEIEDLVADELVEETSQKRDEFEARNSTVGLLAKMSLQEALKDKTAGPRPICIEEYRARNLQKPPTQPAAFAEAKEKPLRAGLHHRIRRELADLYRVAAIAEKGNKVEILKKINKLKEERRLHRSLQKKKKKCPA
ncbi:uncharacterized protein LOC119654117 [Hermetia illucens]|uniref:uncharacterized protein LOC119654117 n=1 Tax=Hermetia illucens TaxID=343691 RepID=UPI0018CC0D3B|nr:uncharacterized protein LOC119654117 [Hermetia illucens]